MRTETTTRELYKFNELSDEAQDKAVEKLADINVDYEDWYIWTLEAAAEQWEEKYGLIFDPKTTYFDFDRAFWIAFKDIYVDDYKKLYRALEMSHGEKLALTRGDMGFDFRMSYHSGSRMSTSLEIDDYRDPIAPDLTVDPDQWFTEIYQTLLYDIQNTYEHLVSEEAIIETIEANEYEFTANGEL